MVLMKCINSTEYKSNICRVIRIFRHRFGGGAVGAHYKNLQYSSFIARGGCESPGDFYMEAKQSLSRSLGASAAPWESQPQFGSLSRNSGASADTRESQPKRGSLGQNAGASAKTREPLLTLQQGIRPTSFKMKQFYTERRETTAVGKQSPRRRTPDDRCREKIAAAGQYRRREESDASIVADAELKDFDAAT